MCAPIQIYHCGKGHLIVKRLAFLEAKYSSLIFDKFELLFVIIDYVFERYIVISLQIIKASNFSHTPSGESFRIARDTLVRDR